MPGVELKRVSVEAGAQRLAGRGPVQMVDRVAAVSDWRCLATLAVKHER